MITETRRYESALGKPEQLNFELTTAEPFG